VVCLIGSGEVLGRWNVDNAVLLQTGPQLFPRWKAVLPLAASGAECKLIIKRKGGSVDWEPGDNRSFPSTQLPATVRMSYGRKEMDLIPDSGQNGYPAEPKSSPDASPSFQEMMLQNGNSQPKSRTDLRQRLMDLDFKKHIEERYEIESTKIGEGGFGTVSPAKDKATGIRRAVKMLMKAHVQNVDSLRKEIEITQKLDHPNIVRLFAVYEDRCCLYLVMELCEGGELFDRLVEEKYLTEPTVRKVMKQVFSSIAYCHTKDVVHRDLKPENYILLSKCKAVDQTPVKLIDFGLANRCEESQQLHTAVGTSYYVAPEVLNQKYGKSVDVWSCGVLMYCLHCGSPPFFGKTDIEVLKKVKRGHYSMGGSIWSSVSALAKDLIRGCLEMDPAKRLTSMQALNHGWFQVHNSTALLDAKVLGNLRNFSVANRFQKAAMTAVAYQLTTEEQAELREVFTKLDANSDGYLSFQEIKQGMECQLNEAHFPNLSEILASMDTNNDGKIEYTEFIAAAMDHRLQRNESLCWRAFKAFDKDDDGKITLSELKQVLKDDELQQEVPSSRSSSFYFDAMDTDGNGEVSFEEFMDMLYSQSSPQNRKAKSTNLEVLVTSIDSDTPQ